MRAEIETRASAETSCPIDLAEALIRHVNFAETETLEVDDSDEFLKVILTDCEPDTFVAVSNLLKEKGYV